MNSIGPHTRSVPPAPAPVAAMPRSGAVSPVRARSVVAPASRPEPAPRAIDPFVFEHAAVIPASIWELAAVIDDPEHTCGWVANCVENTLLQRLGPGHVLTYHRTGNIGFVNDRAGICESIMRRSEVAGQPTVTVEVAAQIDHPSYPARRGVTQLKHLRAVFTLTEEAPDRTHARYDVAVDPDVRGRVLRGLARFFTQPIPRHTLSSLAQQVETAAQRRRWREAGEQLRRQL